MIIHLSAFYDENNPKRSDTMMKYFISLMLNNYPKVKILVYSRTPAENSSLILKNRWDDLVNCINNFEKKAKDRTAFIKSRRKESPDYNYFADPNISIKFKKEIRKLLSIQ